MVQLADRDAIDTLAATLFSRDHPDRCWDPLDELHLKLGSATALEKAVYRGFARGRIESDSRAAMPAPEVAAAALAADALGRTKPGA